MEEIKVSGPQWDHPHIGHPKSWCLGVSMGLGMSRPWCAPPLCLAPSSAAQVWLWYHPIGDHTSPGAHVLQIWWLPSIQRSSPRVPLYSPLYFPPPQWAAECSPLIHPWNVIQISPLKCHLNYLFHRAKQETIIQNRRERVNEHLLQQHQVGFWSILNGQP